MQLHFEFTWPELTQEEIKEALSHFSIKLGYFVVVDLVEGSVYYANADLFRCKKAIPE